MLQHNLTFVSCYSKRALCPFSTHALTGTVPILHTATHRGHFLKGTVPLQSEGTFGPIVALLITKAACPDFLPWLLGDMSHVLVQDVTLIEWHLGQGIHNFTVLSIMFRSRAPQTFIIWVVV